MILPHAARFNCYTLVIQSIFGSPLGCRTSSAQCLRNNTATPNIPLTICIRSPFVFFIVSWQFHQSNVYFSIVMGLQSLMLCVTQIHANIRIQNVDHMTTICGCRPHSLVWYIIHMYTTLCPSLLDLLFLLDSRLMIGKEFAQRLRAIGDACRSFTIILRFAHPFTM